MSLPHVLGTSLETIPAFDPPLEPSSRSRNKWRQRVESWPRKPRIGIVWAGNLDHPNNINRSLELSEFARLFDLDSVSFVSFQKDPDPEEMSSFVHRDRLLDLSPDLTDFADTTAALEHVDLLISADTSIVHLAGSMGVEV